VRRGRALLLVIALPLSVASIASIHFGIRAASHIDAPEVRLPLFHVEGSGGVKRAGRSSVRSVGKILEVRLQGSPEEIGAEHAVLLRDEMIQTEGVVWDLLDRKVTSKAARLLLLDAGQFAYRHVADALGDARRRELAASALQFHPDPFADRFDTFQRFVYLSALYDISLAYEHSPLLGCTTFTFSGAASGGSPLLGRAFDFDVHDVFDEKKAVFLVLEDGKIPFASVSWPGLVGVVTGMNREGLAMVVHGARAGQPRTTGEPVVDELRRLLSRTRTTDEAVRAIAETEPLVSHIVIVSDASGHAVAIERVPGAPVFSRPLGERAAVTNHLEGPFASDPKNQRVRDSSSTLARRARGDELVQGLDHPATAVDVVRMLRDRRGPGGRELPLGDRHAVDALIATHAVVMETAARRLWVSEAPHALGRFLAFDLERLLGPSEDAGNAGAPEDGTSRPTIAADPMLESGEYSRLRAGAIVTSGMSH
jgi:isopenicillin-N N-acyltransferase-like protein